MDDFGLAIASLLLIGFVALIAIARGRPDDEPTATSEPAPISPPPEPRRLNPHATLTGRAYVIDGDTIIVQKRKIRLAGIDAPEIDMPWGRKAKGAMIQICRGQTLTVRLNGETSFDRLVGTAYLPDGRDIGAEIVKTGLALDCAQFSGGKYRVFEPEGARARLRHGFYGHSSLRWKNRT